MTNRYRRPVTIYLPPAAREALEARAAADARTVSKQGELLLVQALGVGGAGTEPVAPATERRGGGAGRARSPRPASAEPAKRTAPCVHRIPADAFCARCDPA